MNSFKAHFTIQNLITETVDNISDYTLLCIMIHNFDNIPWTLSVIIYWLECFNDIHTIEKINH